MINKANILLKKIAESKFSKDTIWLIGSQGVLVVSGLLVNLLIGKELGSSELGIFNQVLGYYAILSTIFSLGLNNSIIKKISSLSQDQYRIQKEKQLLSSNFFLTFLFSTILTGLTIMVIYNWPQIISSKELANALIIPLLSLPFFNLNKNFMAYYSGKRMQKQFSFVRSLRWVLIIGFISICISLKLDEKTILYSFLFSEIILVVYSSIQLRKLFTLNFNKEILKDNFSFGFKSFSAELFAIFNDKFDILIIGYFLTNSEVGIYSFYIFFAKSLYIFPGILQQNINPIISKYHSENNLIELQNKFNRIRKVNLLVLLIQSIAVIIMYLIIVHYFKADFKNSLHLLVISMIGIFPSALISWSGAILVMIGKLKENVIRTFSIMAISLSLTVIFSYFYGLLGATLAVSISSFLSFIMMNSFVRRLVGLKIV